jgi:hypothetical protein
VLRPGGRAISIEGEARAARGLRLFQSSTPMLPAADVCARFEAAGFRATRTLGESGGASYAEGVKAR